MNYYEFVKRYGSDVYLFRNQVFLPLGLTFTQYIAEDEFLSLPAWAKPLALLHAVVISEKDATGERGLTKLTIDELKQRIDETLPQDVIDERRATSLQIKLFKETHIDGTVGAGGNRILVLQTPFDRGWHAFIDGRTAATLNTDAGLLGVPLIAGEHRLDLRYRSPLIDTGAIVSLLACCIFLGTAWKWPRLTLP
jgi:hypothetical protein